jgi:type II restriction enzyme
MQMRLDLPTGHFVNYKSPSQRVRVATETWGSQNLYCPNCAENRLDCTPPNTPTVDYVCCGCRAAFQLKSQYSPFSFRIVDAAYNSMRDAIRSNRTPNLFIVQYDRKRWVVSNAILIPNFAFSMSAIEKRKALGPDARRTGWVGCNVLLGRIPTDAKIPIVTKGCAIRTSVVRKQYARLRPLETLPSENRGWTLDVLNAVRGLGKSDFALSDIYALETSLAQLYPHNHHVRDKIRQQLQVLRDLGLLVFLGHGRYRMAKETENN